MLLGVSMVSGGGGVTMLLGVSMVSGVAGVTMLLGVSMVSGGGGCYYVARSQYGIRGWGVLLCC